MPEMPPIHLLRPGWLAGIPLVALLLVWNARLGRAASIWRGHIADHLLRHLVVRPRRTGVIGPAEWLFATLGLACLALAGPSWQQQPPPFADDKAALVIILDLRDSMLATDVAPTRLQRARLKLRELLALRPDGRTGLVAVGRTVHRVLPFTEDSAAVRTYLDVLDPRLMPAPPRAAGDGVGRAVSLASSMLERDGGRGSVLLVTDTPPAVDDGPDGLVVWMFGPSDAIKERSAAVIPWSADDADVAAVNRALVRQLEASGRLSAQERWKDGGPWLLGPLLLLALVGARRGWSLKW